MMYKHYEVKVALKDSAGEKIEVMDWKISESPQVKVART